MKDRSLRVLSIAVILLGAVIFIQEFWLAQESSREEVRTKTFSVDQASLTQMQFISTNATVECIKDNGTWMVGESGQGMGPADVAIFYQLISALNRTTNSTTITAKELKLRGLNLAEYGFDPPTVEIVSIDNEGRRRWQIGRTTPLGNEVYVRASDRDEIHTIPSAILKIIPTDPDLLRNRVVFASDIAGIKRIEIRGASGFIRIVKELANNWRLQQPIDAQADPYEIATFLENLYKIRIEDFLADNVSDFSAYGLQSETKQVSLGSSDGSSRTIVLGDSIPGRPELVYARRTDETSVFALYSGVLDLLDMSADTFRDARVLSIRKENISHITMQHGNELLELSETDAGGWQVLDPVVWKADPEAVYNLIDLWSHAVITTYDVATNSVPAEWILEFSSRDATHTNRIEVLPSENLKDGLLVRLNRDPVLFQINLPAIPETIINPMLYKDRQIWNLRKEDINKLVLQRNTQNRQVVALNENGVFMAAETNGNAQVNVDMVYSILDHISGMSTSGYIAYNPRNLDIYGLSSPAVELYVGLVDSNELGRVLLVGRESSDGFYSMIKGRDVVFYLDKETVDIISSDLVVTPSASIQVDE